MFWSGFRASILPCDCRRWVRRWRVPLWYLRVPGNLSFARTHLLECVSAQFCSASSHNWYYRISHYKTRIPIPLAITIQCPWGRDHIGPRYMRREVSPRDRIEAKGWCYAGVEGAGFCEGRTCKRPKLVRPVMSSSHVHPEFIYLVVFSIMFCF